MKNFPFVITVSSEKGGVGKTTLATNLAIFLKALHDDLPVTIFSFDNHFTIDRMFSFKGQSPGGSVAEMISGGLQRSLVQTGQYGVDYIPSSHNLRSPAHAFSGPMDLARAVARSGLDGILIIDTRPDLDLQTENALFAADRVLIPVKDMPSLENCRNIFALFDKRGLDKKSLLLVPCLVDERIKFDGPFSDQKSLLKAFAINRGYRCHDIYISKSPKVESLNTNPEGKIFPILTHGRGTDVYGQFFGLARTILAEYNDTAEPRSYLYHSWLTAESERDRQALVARLDGMRKECPLCCKDLLGTAASIPSFYFETADGAHRGLLDEDCLLDVLSSSVYGMDRASVSGAARDLLRETARESAYLFRPLAKEGFKGVDFMRFDTGGEILTRRLVPFREHAGGMFHDDKCSLFDLLAKTMDRYGDGFDDRFLLLYPAPPADPASILSKEPFRALAQFKRNISPHLDE
jgi:MinD-like ATPase involved in chromosome partitioning or flagellar assembly